ncbi:MAG: hypothetical protein O3A25_18925 [Acidobacteria bacterium]|nr:hypothetical protein [Acidobacteriota bacterium]
MALATTTLSAAITANSRSIVVASAASMAAGRLILIDEEWMQATQDYTSGTTVNVLRGRNGSAAVAHVVTANITHGLGSDFSQAPAGDASAQTRPQQRVRRLESITATSSVTLPKAGEDLLVILNGTSVITLTVPVPTKDLDGCFLYIVGNGAAAHVLTFTGGLSGAGSSYDVITVNSTKPISVGPFIACNGFWSAPNAVPLAGTVTNILGTVT